MNYNIPSINQLTNDQKELLRIFYNKDLIIQGGPGTGKTILAIHCALALAKAQENVTIITFNKTLTKYINGTLNEKQKSKITVITFDSWFGKICRNSTKFYIPPDQYFEIRFEKALEFSNIIEKPKANNVIIDEAQDLPYGAHKFINSYFKRHLVFIDENQSINSSNIIKLSQVKKAYNIPDYVFTLTQNFRNTHLIYQFSNSFSRSNIKTELLNNDFGLPPNLIKLKDKNEIINEIKQKILENPSKSIGIVYPHYPNSNEFNFLVKSLKESLSYSQENLKRVTFNYGKNSELDFFDNNVHILTTNTVKGLEYDIVIIPFVDNLFFTNEIDENIRKIYVAITRAKSEVYSYYFQDKSNSFYLMRHKEYELSVVDGNELI